MKNKSAKWWVGAGSCAVLFVGIVSFAYMKMSFLITGVQIQANVAHNDSSSVIEIKGNAKNAVHLSLNGREIFIDRDGIFSEPIALLPGLGVVTLHAQDKFGKSAEKKFEIVYKEGSGAVALRTIPITTN